MGFIFKPVRWVLAQIIIFIDWITRPKPVEREVQKQAKIDQQTTLKHAMRAMTRNGIRN